MVKETEGMDGFTFYVLWNLSLSWNFHGGGSDGWMDGWMDGTWSGLRDSGIYIYTYMYIYVDDDVLN